MDRPSVPASFVSWSEVAPLGIESGTRCSGGFFAPLQEHSLIFSLHEACIASGTIQGSLNLFLRLTA